MSGRENKRGRPRLFSSGFSVNAFGSMKKVILPLFTKSRLYLCQLRLRIWSSFMFSGLNSKELLFFKKFLSRLLFWFFQHSPSSDLKYFWDAENPINSFDPFFTSIPSFVINPRCLKNQKLKQEYINSYKEINKSQRESKNILTWSLTKLLW